MEQGVAADAAARDRPGHLEQSDFLANCSFSHPATQGRKERYLGIIFFQHWVNTACSPNWLESALFTLLKHLPPATQAARSGTWAPSLAATPRTFWWRRRGWMWWWRGEPAGAEAERLDNSYVHATALRLLEMSLLWTLLVGSVFTCRCCQWWSSCLVLFAAARSYLLQSMSLLLRLQGPGRHCGAPCCNVGTHRCVHFAALCWCCCPFKPTRMFILLACSAMPAPLLLWRSFFTSIGDASPAFACRPLVCCRRDWRWQDFRPSCGRCHPHVSWPASVCSAIGAAAV